MNSPLRLKDRKIAARWTFGFALAIFVHRFFTHSLLSQMQAPPLRYVSFDYTYWLYQATGIPKFIVQSHTGALIFDIILLFSTLYCCVTGATKRLPMFVAALGWTLYALSYNAYSYHHNVTMIGITVLPWAFMATKPETFALTWRGFRYFCLFIYADAFINKAFIGRNLFDPSMGTEIIKTNQSLYMVAHPDSTLTACYSFFITHPLLSYIGFCAMVAMQGAMIIGFFTRRFDAILFWLPFVFHTMTLLFVDVFFYEVLILNLTLLPLAGSQDQGQIRSLQQPDISDLPSPITPENNQIITQR